MKANRLTIGTNTGGKPVTLPEEIITQSVAILAKRRSGKSYLADVIAEELLGRPQQTVIVDPTGVHWGLRSSMDGRKPGFPILVFGGKHADLPLEEGSGEMLAQAIVEQKFSAIIDTSLLRKNQTLRFLDAFLGTLYHLNADLLHLILDEVDYYCPQKPNSPLEAITTGHVDDLVRRGGVKGIGVTLLTQRSSVVNKNVLTQCEVLMTLRLVHPLDIKAVMDWVGMHADPKMADTMVKSLPALPVGSAWLWWPAEEIFELVKVRAKTTFDSGRTPKPGDKAPAPKVLAKVDLEALGEKMKATIERAKENDPRILRTQLAALQRELAAKPASAGIPEAKMEQLLEAEYQDGIQAGLALAPPVSAAALATFGELLSRIRIAQDGALKEGADLIADFRRQAVEAKGPKAPSRQAMRQVPAQGAVPRAASIPERKERIQIPHDHNELSKPQQKILDAMVQLALYGMTPARRASIAAHAGVSVRSSGFEKNISTLKTMGYITYPAPDMAALTPEGEAKAAEPSKDLSLDELHSRWLQVISGPQQILLRVLIDAHPGSLSRERLAADAGVSAVSSGFEKNVSTLKTLGAITYPDKGHVAASDLLFPEGLH